MSFCYCWCAIRHRFVSVFIGNRKANCCTPFDREKRIEIEKETETQIKAMMAMEQRCNEVNRTYLTFIILLLNNKHVLHSGIFLANLRRIRDKIRTHFILFSKRLIPNASGALVILLGYEFEQI